MRGQAQLRKLHRDSRGDRLPWEHWTCWGEGCELVGSKTGFRVGSEANGTLMTGVSWKGGLPPKAMYWRHSGHSATEDCG